MSNELLNASPLDALKELEVTRPKKYRLITIYLDTARDKQRMMFPGNYIYAVDATDKDVTLDIRFDSEQHDAITFNKHRGCRTPFRDFYLTHGAQAGKTITLAIATEDEQFQMIDAGLAELTSAVSIGGAGGTPAGSRVSIPNTVTLIKAANVNRRSIMVQNLSSNLLYVGLSATLAVADAEHILPQYTSMTFEHTAAIYGIKAVAGPEEIGYTEEVN